MADHDRYPCCPECCCLQDCDDLPFELTAILHQVHGSGFDGEVGLLGIGGFLWQGTGVFTVNNLGVPTVYTVTLIYDCVHQALSMDMDPVCTDPEFVPNPQVTTCLPITCPLTCPMGQVFQFLLSPTLPNPDPPPDFNPEPCGCDTPQTCTLLITVTDA